MDANSWPSGRRLMCSICQSPGVTAPSTPVSGPYVPLLTRVRERLLWGDAASQLQSPRFMPSTQIFLLTVTEITLVHLSMN